MVTHDYLLTGTKPNDEKLQHDDIILSRPKNTITIKGEINRPGICELKPMETLKDLLKIAGNLKVTSYLDRAQVDRIVPFDLREKLGMDRKIIDIKLGDIANEKRYFISKMVI